MTEARQLVELIQTTLRESSQELPVFHTVAVKLQQLLASRTFEIDDVIELISEDQSLSGRVLRVANSSYYAGLSKIATIKDAIVRLGAQEIANMAMLASQFEYYNSSNDVLNRLMQELWGHALSCAVGAKWLTRRGGYPGMAAEAFMGGLMHDIGKLALLKVLDDILRDGQTEVELTEPLIGGIMEAMHEEVGYALMKGWNFPEFYCEIAGRHHAREFDQNNILLVAVRLANLTCRRLGRSHHPRDPSILLSELPETRFLGLSESALVELEIVIEDADGICVG
ncbi:HDOD domain-containing protein [Trichlorobacter ammonificans]|uniref:HD-like signal output (HDOD) domain, no enzymatic activity n=1 Tax=Trichlorobacter ammonificans TaxID=2916410 RepID=A0ABN8HKL1_9BACT|nr:HDOD domain-containing protein [Trichlorobacter ammonificans]CAH2031581.1 HD-like signal output (HDOD) domain, no enzymatic activity [Trichlorobacter ammonificans]